MAYTIKLEPGGRIFSARQGERLLSAALRQGIHLPYGCRTGSCGTCRAHLLAGDIAYPDGPPLALTVLEMHSGEALLCRAVATADLVLGAREIDAMAGLQVRAFPSRIARMQPLAHDVMALYLRLPPVERLHFLPGQYVDVLIDGTHRRSFSLASPPHDDQLLELHVRHVPGGRFTTEVFHKLHEGALLRLQGPLGRFVLRSESTRPMLMVAGGTGFAPIKAMLRHLWEQLQQSRAVTFYWGVRARRDLYADAWLREQTRSHPGFDYIPVLSEPGPDDAWAGRTGWVHDAVIADHPDLGRFDIYLSGPPPMIDAARKAFPAAGADPARMFSDAFDFAPEVRAALNQNITPD